MCSAPELLVHARPDLGAPLPDRAGPDGVRQRGAVGALQPALHPHPNRERGRRHRRVPGDLPVSERKTVEFRTSPEGDWVRAYIDGKLIGEGHSLGPRAWRDLCYELGADFIQREAPEEYNDV